MDLPEKHPRWRIGAKLFRSWAREAVSGMGNLGIYLD